MKRKAINSFILATSVLFLIACGSDNKSNVEDGVASGGTSLSIVYESSEYDATKGLIGHYHVHAVDENGKPISGLSIIPSVINGVKEIRNQKMQYTTGNILSTTPISFSDNGINFSQSGVALNDTLMIIPSNGKVNNSYIGDWTIRGVSTDLIFKERSFHLETTEGLTYIIGNDERLLGRTLAVVHLDKVKNVTDSKGFAYFDVVFDPILAGHTVTLGAHTDGNRMGTALVASLRGAEFSAPEVIVLNTGATYFESITISIIPNGGAGTEHLIDVSINPSSFIVDPAQNCFLGDESDFHTNSAGRVLLAIHTDGNTTATEDCTVTWQGGAGSLFLEY